MSFFDRNPRNWTHVLKEKKKRSGGRKRRDGECQLVWSRFQQHFTGYFFANILLRENIQTVCK